jgi:hypothetical protein
MTDTINGRRVTVDPEKLSVKSLLLKESKWWAEDRSNFLKLIEERKPDVKKKAAT